jgi:hypothetical protein
MKKYTNKKVLLGFLALISVIAIICVSSFVPFIIDPTQWQTTEFLSDELIIVAITIFGVVCVMFIGQASNQANPNSNIAKAKVKFYGKVEKITNISGFCQWVKKVLQPNDIKSAKQRKMLQNKIEDTNILKLSLKEIKSLIDTPQKIEGIFYRGITKKQYRALKRIKNGKLKIDLVEPTYYLTFKAIDSDKTITERSGKESSKKTWLMAYSVGSKVVITLIVAMIMASFVRDTASGDNDLANSFLKFFNRIFALITSSFMGFIVGSQTNDIDAEFIEMRVLVQEMYLQDTTFVPLSEQELAKQEYIERVKKENVIGIDYDKGKN